MGIFEKEKEIEESYEKLICTVTFLKEKFSPHDDIQGVYHEYMFCGPVTSIKNT